LAKLHDLGLVQSILVKGSGLVLYRGANLRVICQHVHNGGFLVEADVPGKRWQEYVFFFAKMCAARDFPEFHEGRGDFVKACAALGPGKLRRPGNRQGLH
jgi:hypothetical protein